MKKLMTIALLVWGFGATIAEDNAKSEINDQVWSVFTESYRLTDADMYVTIYHPDIIRASAKRVVSGAEYIAEIKDWFEDIKKNGRQTGDIQFRFLSRVSNDDSAFERGVFRWVFTGPDGNERTSYGEFQVALKKYNGVWKILFDTDARSTEEVWNKATPMDE